MLPTVLIHEQHCFSLRQLLGLPHSIYSSLHCSIKAETLVHWFALKCLVRSWCCHLRSQFTSSIAIHLGVAALWAIPNCALVKNTWTRYSLLHGTQVVAFVLLQFILYTGPHLIWSSEEISTYQKNELKLQSSPFYNLSLVSVQGHKSWNISKIFKSF